MKQYVQEASADQRAEKRRLISVHYRGLAISLHVSSLTEELDVRITALQKGIALSTGLIPAMPGEELLMPLEKADPISIAEATLKQWQSARKECIRLCEGEHAETIAAVVSCMQRSGRSLLLIDRTFRLDVAWYIPIKEKSGAMIMQQRLLELLPREQMHKSTEAMRSRLWSMGHLEYFSERQVKDNVTLCWKWCSTFRKAFP